MRGFLIMSPFHGVFTGFNPDRTLSWTTSIDNVELHVYSTREEADLALPTIRLHAADVEVVDRRDPRLPIIKCEDRCYSPIACGAFGFCRRPLLNVAMLDIGGEAIKGWREYMSWFK